MDASKLQEVIPFPEAKTLYMEATKVFQPRAPITLTELFAGRWDQLTTVVDSVAQHGLHVAIYGERGVGKTSLSNVVRPTINAFDKKAAGGTVSPFRLIVRANANSGEDFSSIWNKLFADITWKDNRPGIGLVPTARNITTLKTAFGLGDRLSVEDVRRTLVHLPNSVFIVDEFDRASSEASRNFTDLIKGLSDHSINSTVILVGVAETVDKLIADHQSISRCLIQVLLPRMEPQELRQILVNAEDKLSIAFDPDAKDLIVRVSQGLPHYTHLIGLNAVRKAVYDRFSRIIDRRDVFDALREAVKQAEQTVQDKHIRATHSAHKDALYRQVLLACAVAAATSQDALGFFSASSLVGCLEKILSRPVEIAVFANHLTEFCKPNRASVLERTGQPRAYRYRFQDPLLVPFVFMDAISNGLITNDSLNELLNRSEG